MAKIDQVGQQKTVTNNFSSSEEKNKACEDLL